MALQPAASLRLSLVGTPCETIDDTFSIDSSSYLVLFQPFSNDFLYSALLIFSIKLFFYHLIELFDFFTLVFGTFLLPFNWAVCVNACGVEQCICIHPSIPGFVFFRACLCGSTGTLPYRLPARAVQHRSKSRFHAAHWHTALRTSSVHQSQFSYRLTFWHYFLTDLSY